MRIMEIGRLAIGLALGSGFIALAQDEPARPESGANHWKAAASSYRITLDSGKLIPLTLRDEPVLKWTNPQRRTDDGAVFVWTDRGRPEVVASFYRYRWENKAFEDHEFISLATSPLGARHEGEKVWDLSAGHLRPRPIPDAPRPAATAPERLRQMRALAREFRANFNNPPDVSEIRLLPQPLYRFETEGKRADVLDGALFAFVHTTDPEVLLTIEARPESQGRPMAWHYSIARMSMVGLQVRHKDREVWSVEWASNLKDPSQPYMVRSHPLEP